jgi:hypothetical protein
VHPACLSSENLSLSAIQESVSEKNSNPAAAQYDITAVLHDYFFLISLLPQSFS